MLLIKTIRDTEYSADHIIIATGTLSRELPNLPQMVQSNRLPSSNDFTNLQPKSMIIVGSGAIES
jgi:dihydrolipoamide dehydrogenase